MQSDLLLKNGLIHKIGGSDYNFRSQTIGEDQMKREIERLSAEMDCAVTNYYLGQQVHGKHVQNISEGYPEKFAGGYLFPGTDGLMTDEPGVALVIKFADCTPIVLYDPVRKVQANVHSGWRSTVQKIASVAIEKMVRDFGSRREDILAYIGPSIAQNDYEVGEEVYEAFKGFPKREQFFISKANGKYLLDVAQANQLLLQEEGILPGHLEISKKKTYHDPALHSARAEGANYGLNAIMTVIQNEGV